MLPLLLKILPYIFLSYFVYRYLKEPIYLLGVPFLMFLRQSIFFDTVKIFAIPGRLGPEVLLFAWLCIIWALIKIKSKNQIGNDNDDKLSIHGISWIDYIVIILIFITVIGVVLVYEENYVVEDIITQFITLLSLFLGYFIVRDSLRYTNFINLSKFLYNIVIVNSIASILYFIHQGLHVTIYTANADDEYLVDVFQGEVITRTFWFMPALWFFSIAYLLVFKREKTIAFISLISINILAIFISYTRSFLIIALLVIVVYFLLTGYKNKDIGKIIKNVAIVGVAGLALFIGISIFLPASKNYFVDRFSELDNNSADDAQSNTLIYRFEQTSDVINRIDKDKVLIGHGPITEIQLPFVAMMRSTTADMAWTGVAFRWGYVGLALFALLFVGALLKAFFLFLKTEGIISQLALVMLLVIFSQIVESFTSWTFMAPNRFAMGFWYFAILSALISVNSNKYGITIKEEYGEQ